MSPIDWTKKTYGKEATRLLKRRWLDLLAIAGALCERETLSHEEVLRVVRKKAETEARELVPKPTAR